MWSRIVSLALFLGIVGATSGRAQQTYSTDYGIESAIIATGNSIFASYFGWEATTVYGHEIYALTGAQYQTDLTNNCFAFDAAGRANCQGAGNQDLGGLLGVALFGRSYGVNCPFPAAVCHGPETDVTFSWVPNTEIIFAMMVNQNNGEYNWFFSGDPARNKNQDGTDGYAHLAYFPNGVGGDNGVGIVPGTQGLALFGFEDVTYRYSDWDFDNAIFAVSANSIGVPSAVTPEPATMSLLASGLTSLGLVGLRRRNRKSLSA